MDTDVMARITAQIGNGVTKDAAKGFVMDGEASAFWDKVEGEFADAKAKGMQVDMPGEWPAPDDAPAPAPDGAPPVAPSPSPGMAAPATPSA